MKIRLLPLAMLAGLAGAANAVLDYVKNGFEFVVTLIAQVADVEPVKFAAEVQSARAHPFSFLLAVVPAVRSRTNQARNYVAMLRSIGGRSCTASHA